MAALLGFLGLFGSTYAAGGLGGRASVCGSVPPFAPGSFNIDVINASGIEREYGVWVPKNYQQNVSTKLIFSYHGAGGTIARQRALDGLTEPAFNTDHIVIYLQGLENDDGKTTWEGAPQAKFDDLGFTSDLLNRIEGEFCIDERHIYATGKSQGGGFVGRLACDPNLSKRFAAFAPVSGAYYNASITKRAECHPQTMPILCDPGRKDIPILAFHGGADDTVSYFGGYRKKACLPDIRYWIGQWSEREGLGETAVNNLIAGTNGGINITYGGGLVKLVFDGWNIPHDWPATFENSDNGGQNLTSFNATTWIMEFFGAHALG
ncbi:uncharacterized protein JN550_005538 [Neoarthrinium moseri]|uniref:uncharacterized protein n=1 Tax=Neoarthrinium moseri TaxID=1658444 RepID=UPI001FDDBA6C|nr:uncharacterized protein JN550_005538 [Neoarthrinium moseri]KAI1869948.1 hypothetical protein JN550_005538 [Neoarthrinium moseri]